MARLDRLDQEGNRVLQVNQGRKAIRGHKACVVLKVIRVKQGHRGCQVHKALKVHQGRLVHGGSMDRKGQKGQEEKQAYKDRLVPLGHKV